MVLEHRQVRIVSIGGMLVREWCDACAAVVAFVPPEVAARVADLSAPSLDDRALAGEIHVSHTAVAGRTLVCLSSLLTSQG
jgi:hypothetical protein